MVVVPMEDVPMGDDVIPVNNEEAPQPETPAPPPPVVEEPLQIVRREGWQALYPRTIVKANLPFHFIVFCYCTGSGPCTTSEECVSEVRNLQKKHMIVRKLSDIAYNFLIGGDGNVYEGRGWMVNPPRFPYHPTINNKTYYIGLIGDHKDERPSTSIWTSTWKIVETAYKKGYITQSVGFLFEDNFSYRTFPLEKFS